MSYRRETAWKDMLDSDTNFLNVLVILMASGGQQRGWDFVSFKKIEKVINKKVMYIWVKCTQECILIRLWKIDIGELIAFQAVHLWFFFFILELDLWY